MARRPDAPCAGGCGKMLWGGQTSLPAGVRCCRECRSAGRAPVEPRRPDRPVRLCELRGCEEKHLARGMCRKHYRAWQYENSGDQKNPIQIIGGIASLFGAYFPKPKPIKIRVPVGVMAYCPWCDAVMGGISPTNRFCHYCGTTVVLNEEEVSWVISEKHSTEALRRTTQSSLVSTPR